MRFYVLCIGLYSGIAFISLLLGRFISSVINEPDDVMSYAWLMSTIGFTFSLAYIINNLM